ncbi:hypothetical protein LINPERPRIM_LOCUS35319 [Linum perenne]
MFEKNKDNSIRPRIATKIKKWKIVGRHATIRQTLALVCECVLGDFGYVVDLDRNTCTCGYWELSAIPCVHAVACASFLRKDIYYWVDQVYYQRYAMQAYGYGGIPAMPGQQAWEEAPVNVIHPPVQRVMPGRPKKNRRKEQQELEVRPRKNGVGSVLSKKGIVMHCRTCKGRGHNVRKCPNKDTLPATENVPAVENVPVADQRPGVSTRRPTRPPTEGPSRPVQRRRKPPTCGSCREVGHNARSCLRNRGVQVSILT